MSVLAALAAAFAAALFWPVPAGLSTSSSSRVSRSGPILMAGLGALALVHFVQGTRLVLGLIGLGVALGIAGLVTRSRRTAAAERLADLVLQVCEGMAAELRAGQTPETALERAAAQWSPLGSAASAARLGGDVPGALRDLAGLRGAEALRVMAAAWQVSHRSGSGLAASLTRAVSGLRERRRTARVVASELASARATAHVMAALPVGVLALGSGVGGDPVGVLLGTPFGLGCLGSGAALGLLGLFWLQRISDAVLAS